VTKLQQLSTYHKSNQISYSFKSQSQSFLMTYGQLALRSSYQATYWHPLSICLSLPRKLSTVISLFFLYESPSLLRVRVYSLLVQIVMELGRSVTLASKSRRTWHHTYCFVWDQVPFLSPLTTRRDTVEVFYPAFTLSYCDSFYKFILPVTSQNRASRKFYSSVAVQLLC
jgi:hypothetical protein